MDQQTPTPTKIKLLGGLDVVHSGGTVSFATKKAAVLFAFLTLYSGKRNSRERLAAMMWPESDEQRSRRNLNTAIWRVRVAIENVTGLTLRTDRDTVSLVSSGAQVDVHGFLQALKAGENASGEERLQLLLEAESGYTGDFLDGFYEPWCEEERNVLRNLYMEVLRSLAEMFHERQEYAKASSRLSRLVQMDPYDEAAHRGLILGQYLSGNRAAALEHYEIMKGFLASELAIEPTDETTHLYQHILAQGGRIGRASADDFSSVGETLQVPGDTPLLGRERELVQIVTDIGSAVQGRGGATAIIGGPGIGKSRLVRSAIAEAEIRGVEVLRGRCPDMQSAPPYQVLIQAIWPRVSAEINSAGPWASVLRALVDAVSSEYPRTSGDRFRFPATDRAILDECILNTLISHSSDRPALLVLEDLHRVDEATEHFLVTLLNRLGSTKLHVLATLREDEDDGPRVLSALVDNGVQVVSLGPLKQGDVAQLVGSTLGTPDVPDSLVRFIWERSTGVPLFVLELLRSIIAERCLSKGPKGRLVLDGERLVAKAKELPIGLKELIRRRLMKFGDKEKAVVFSAAVLGMESTFGQIEALIGSPEDEFIEATERLVSARFLHETDKGVAFLHEVMRQAVLASIPKHRLRRLHLKAAALLEGTSPGRTSDLAWHYLGAGLYHQAAKQFEAAGDTAMTVHANEDAISWYGRAIDATSYLDGTAPATLRQKALLLLKRQEALDLLGGRERQARDVEALMAVATALGDTTLKAQAALLKCQVLSRLNQNREALEQAKEAEGLFRQVSDRLGQAKALEATGVVYHFHLRNESLADRAFRRALTLYRRTKDRGGEARTLVNLGIVVASGGDNLAALSTLDQAEEILRELPNRRDLAVLLLQKGILYRFVGQARKSDDFLRSGISILRQIGDRIGEARGLSQLAATHVTMGRLRDALHESVKAVRLAREARDIRAQIVFLNNAAYTVLRCVGYFGRARSLASAALEIVTQSGQAENAAIYYDTIGAIFLEEGDLAAALRWLELAREGFRTWEGRYAFVEAEIQYRLGLAWMALGRSRRAYRLLDRASGMWSKWNDVLLQVHAMAALGYLEMALGNREAALRRAREVDRLLRKVDGVEQIQKVHWHQYLVYRGLGLNAAARKALKRAASAVFDQAAMLKGPMRRSFLESVPINREIALEVHRQGVYPLFHDHGKWSLQGRDPLLMMPERRLLVPERRKRLLELLSKSPDRRQSDVASVLHVSTRTLRNDLAALREQGLLVDRSPPQRVQPQETGP